MLMKRAANQIMLIERAKEHSSEQELYRIFSIRVSSSYILKHQISIKIVWKQLLTDFCPMEYIWVHCHDQ